MRISLRDVDSKIPNLALMKISAYHKQKGDVVGFNLHNPDKIYTSIIFKKNKGQALNQSLSDGIEREWGGSGINNNWLPDEIEFIKPDYDLYPSEYSQGFTTRGCIRNCYFCIVPDKEGKLRRWQHPKEFHDERFDTIMIMDNNWIADPEWFFETSGWILDKGLNIMEHGLDIRLVDEKILNRLQDLKIKMYHFAFDKTSKKLESTIRKKVQLLKDCGINTRSNVAFYCYCHNDSMHDDAVYRCNVLKSLNVNADVMFNCDMPKTKRIKSLLKWSWRKQLFWSVDYKNYSKLLHT